MIFVDTGAWFALFVPNDADHAAALRFVHTNRDQLVTTDYVIDELLTLLKVRGEFERALEIGANLLEGRTASVDWVTSNDIDLAWRVFRDYRDKDWSFTDCVSKVIMERLAIYTAFAFDEHFHQFGSVTVVPAA